MEYTHTMEYYAVIKIMIYCHFWQYGWVRGYYDKWNKSGMEIQMPYGLTYIWILKKYIIKLKQTHRHRDQGGGY